MGKSIEFTTAKLAKQKGFILPLDTNRSYFNNSGSIHPYNWYKSDELYDYTDAPTQDELKTWLREKRRIHVSVNPWKDEMDDADPEEIPEEGFQILYEGNIIDVNDDWRTVYDFSYYNDYYECLENLLVEALKLIPEQKKTNKGLMK